jgi:hypothetical protein
MSCPEVDQINAHWNIPKFRWRLKTSKYLKQKSTERSNKNEALVKTETLVSIFGWTKPKANTSVNAERKTGKLFKRQAAKGYRLTVKAVTGQTVNQNIWKNNKTNTFFKQL